MIDLVGLDCDSLVPDHLWFEISAAQLSRHVLMYTKQESRSRDVEDRVGRQTL